MTTRTFNLKSAGCTVSGQLNPDEQQLALSVTYPDGSHLAATLRDGCQNPGKQGRSSLHVPSGQWPFFSAKTVIEYLEPGDGQLAVLLRTPLGEAAKCVYRLDFLEEEQAVLVRTWFEGGLPFIVQQLRWLDFQITATDLDQYRAGLPAWQGTVGAMPEPLSFADFVALKNDGNAFALCNSGRVLLAPGQGQPRLAAFADLLQYQDDLLRFSPNEPLSAWICLAPWAGNDAFLKQRDRLAERFFNLLPQSPAAAVGRTVDIQAGELNVRLDWQDHGLLLASIGGGLPVYEQGTPQALVTLQVLDLKTGQVSQLTSAQGWQSVTVAHQPDRWVFSLVRPLIDNRPADHFTLQLTALARPEQNRVAWLVDVLNQNPGLSVLSCDFPLLAFRQGDWDLFLPKTSGVLLRDATRHGSHLAAIYPAYTLSMPWYAIWQPGRSGLNGFYCGAHDPDGCRKDLSSTTLAGSASGRIRITCPGEGIGHGANSFSLPGQLVWQLFGGDWYDAALLYRAFVHGQADWLPDPALQGRPDSPDWFRDLPFWIMDWLPNGNPDKEPIPVSIRPETPPGPRDWIDLAIQLQKALGVPIGYHVYNWHHIPFNNDFPHYFPVEPGFADGVKELQANDVQVMPYINGRLWDTLDKRDQDFRFSNEALPHAAKHLDGSVMTESYASHEPDGRLCQLAVMCPSTWFWTRELQSITDRLFEEIGVKAVYIDQVAAAAQALCCDPNHNHLPGGGNWWNRSYQALMRVLNRTKPADRAFTTECNAEPHAGSFDGFLTWQWIEPEQVPAFPLIYAGRVAMLGRNINGYKKKDMPYCRFHIAEQVLFGQQIGWINADVVNDPQKFPFLRKMVQLRWQYRDLFNRGLPQRPPLVASDIPDTPSFAGMGRPPAWQVFAMPPVRAGLWLDSQNGKQVLFVINTADRETGCSVELPRIPANGRWIHRETAGEPVLTETAAGSRLEARLEAEGMIVIEWDA